MAEGRVGREIVILPKEGAVDDGLDKPEMFITCRVPQ